MGEHFTEDARVKGGNMAAEFLGKLENTEFVTQVERLSKDENGKKDQPGQHGNTRSLQKIQKLAGHVPVIPATQETEAGGAVS